MKVSKEMKAHLLDRVNNAVTVAIGYNNLMMENETGHKATLEIINERLEKLSEEMEALEVETEDIFTRDVFKNYW